MAITTTDPELTGSLERESPEPLHEQIGIRLQHMILSGAWPAHYRLPAEPELAKRFRVSRGTLRRALRTLISRGYLIQVQGRGTFVRDTQGIEQPIAQEMLSLAEALGQQGVPFVTEVISSALEPPSARLSTMLDVSSSERVLHLVRRRLVSGVPIALLFNFVRADLCPGIEAKDFRARTLFGILEQDYSLTLEWGRRTFEAQAANPQIAKHLDVAPDSPVLYLEQVTYLKNSVPIEYSDVWIRGNAVRLSSLLMRAANVPVMQAERNSARLTWPG